MLFFRTVSNLITSERAKRYLLQYRQLHKKQQYVITNHDFSLEEFHLGRPDARIEGGEDAKWRECIDNETDDEGVICGHPG